MSWCIQESMSVSPLDKTFKRIHLFINRWCKKTNKTKNLFNIYKIILDYYNHKIQLMGIGKTNKSEWKIYKKITNTVSYKHLTMPTIGCV